MGDNILRNSHAPHYNYEFTLVHPAAQERKLGVLGGSSTSHSGKKSALLNPSTTKGPLSESEHSPNSGHATSLLCVNFFCIPVSFF